MDDSVIALERDNAFALILVGEMARSLAISYLTSLFLILPISDSSLATGEEKSDRCCNFAACPILVVLVDDEPAVDGMATDDANATIDDRSSPNSLSSTLSLSLLL